MTPGIESTVLRIQDTLGMSHAELADRLKLTDRQLSLFLRGRKKMPLSNLAALADSLQLSIDNFCSGEIDFLALEKQHLGEIDHIPLKYSQDARSKMRSVNIYLKYIEETYGWAWRRTIMRRFQMSESSILDFDRPIHISFFHDLNAFLKGNGLGISDFFRVGMYSTVVNRSEKGYVAQILSQSESVADAFERLAYLTPRYIEENCKYTVTKERDDLVCFEARERDKPISSRTKSGAGSIDLCMYKAGKFSQLPRYFSSSVGIVEETQCIYRGDSHCRFEIRTDKKPAPSGSHRRSSLSLVTAL